LFASFDSSLQEIAGATLFQSGSDHGDIGGS
jgi:hypothetical protein